MIKIIHISDLHFSSIAGNGNVLDFVDFVRSNPSDMVSTISLVTKTYFSEGHCPLLSFQLARFIFERQNDFDAVLITGDLAHTGRQNDLNLALSFVSAPSHTPGGFTDAASNPTICAAGIPIYIMPGNHDRFRSMAGSPGGAFDTIFSKLWPAGANGVRSIRISGKNGSPIYFVLGDFCLQNAGDASPPIYPWYAGQGKCYEDVVNDMKEETLDIRDAEPKAGVVWVSHFPPSNIIGRSKRGLRLVDHVNILDAANEVGITNILSGHVHEDITHVEKGVNIICSGAACTKSEKAGNFVSCLSFVASNGFAKLVSRSTFRWSDEACDFIRL